MLFHFASGYVYSLQIDVTSLHDWKGFEKNFRRYLNVKGIKQPETLGESYSWYSWRNGRYSRMYVSGAPKALQHENGVDPRKLETTFSSLSSVYVSGIR